MTSSGNPAAAAAANAPGGPRPPNGPAARLLRWLRPGRRVAIAVGVVAAVLIAARVTLALLPHPALRERVPLSRAVTAQDGTLLRLTLSDDGQYRMWTRLDQISPLLIEATLRYEDRHFYWHPGVNPFALARAALSTYVTGSRRIGGSTLTMQLARRLWGLSSRTPLGKLQQLARALQLEAQYSKRDILEAYLNVAPYGGNIEGAGAASILYYRKGAAKLTLGEALTLAVIPQSPVQRTGGAGAAALGRARTELLRAYDAAHPAAGEEVTVRDWPTLKDPRGTPAQSPQEGGSPLPSPLPFRAPHFVEEVLKTDGAPDADGRVVTTLDARLQRLCERHLRAYVARERTRGITNAAALLVDTRTMGVRALVGSADFFDDAIGGQVDGALAPRSPGSTLKPLVYALGMDQGVIHPATMLKDVPTAYAAYSPENFDGRFVGPLSAKDALIRSRNVPALFVAAHLARPTLYDALKTSGIDLPQPEGHYGLGLALGTGEVTMADLVRLYAALGNGGVLRPLQWRQPAPGRATARRAPGEGMRLVSEESAFLVVDMLLDNPPPASRHSPLSATRRVPVAWKTGTSWGFRDAWSVGLFGPYALAVWVGDFSGAGNPAFVGVEAAAPLFFQIVDSIAAEEPGATSFPHPPPRGVRKIEVCALSGGLPTAHCPHRRLSWFVPGRSPIAPCELHRTLALDAQGRRTCPGGPPPVRSEVFEVWPSDLAKQFAAAGLPRRALPASAPGCDGGEVTAGAAPRIVSPLAGVTYDLRRAGGASVDETTVPGATLALQAVTGGDASELFWFADRAFIGKVARGETLFWKPPGAGHYTVRAIDDLGRSDARQVATEVARGSAGQAPR